ncbi:MAG: folate family ECF transporter S component [Clostridia bacterium]|nr:folate family ECF transporter S component [Clostridia bacterium]
MEGVIKVKKVNIRMIAVMAMLIAVGIVLARLLGFYLTPSLRVSFEYFPIILAGVCFGPVAGAIVGGLVDFIGSTVFSGLGFFPPLILGPIFAGLAAGLLAKYAFGNKLDRWWKYMVVSCAADILCNLLWGTFALSLLYGMPFLSYLLVRAPLKLVIAAVDAQLVYSVHRALRPVLKKWQ